MNESLKRSVLLTFPVPVLGLGLAAPLLANEPLRQNASLGVIATGLTLAVAVLFAAAGSRIPRNARVGFSLLVAAGGLTCAELVVQRLTGRGSLFVWTLLPLLFVTALLAAEKGAYAVKKKLLPVLFDGFGIGACFSVLLCAGGLVRSAASLAPSAVKTGAGAVLTPHFLSTAPVVFLLLALVILPVDFAAKRKKGGGL